MKIIVGLGNIGKEYERTHHNMGFLMIDKFAKKNNIEFTKNKCNASVAETHLNGEKVILAKPTTYMNASGVSVRELMAKNGCDISNVLILVDDIDLPAGKYRFRKTGSSGTHNGLRSCVRELNSQDFPRLRIGVGKPDNEDLAEYVLKRIDDEKFCILDKAMDEAMQIIEDFIMGKIN